MAEKKCNHCGTDKNPDNLPYVAHEIAMAQSERNIKRLWIIILVLIVALIGTNLAWIICESQFEVVEETSTTITQDNADGYNNYIGNDGDIVNGAADDNN